MTAKVATQQTESSLQVTGCTCGATNCPDPPHVRLVLVYEGPLWTNNDDANAHRMRVANRTAEMRGMFRQLAEGCPPMRWCQVEVGRESRTRKRPDVGACHNAAKAALDGVVDARVLEDDDDEHVRSILHIPAVYTGRDALVLTLTGPAA